MINCIMAHYVKVKLKILLHIFKEKWMGLAHGAHKGVLGRAPPPSYIFYDMSMNTKKKLIFFLLFCDFSKTETV